MQSLSTEIRRLRRELERARPHQQHYGERLAAEQRSDDSNGHPDVLRRLDRVQSDSDQADDDGWQHSTPAATTPVLDEDGPRISGFFLAVFLFGQVVSTSALISSHFYAWIIGTIFSVLGISVAFCSLISQVQSQHRAMERLSNSIRSNQSSPSSQPAPLDRHVRSHSRVSINS